MKKSSSVSRCEQCGAVENLMVCSRCKKVYYCSKKHQITDWRNHRRRCTKQSVESSVEDSRKCDMNPEHDVIKSDKPPVSVSTLKPLRFGPQDDPEEVNQDGLSPYIDNTTDCKCNAFPGTEPKPANGLHSHDNFAAQISSISLDGSLGGELETVDEICQILVDDMTAYGICVVDNFMGESLGVAVLDEVVDIYKSGIFKDGQLVNNSVKRDSVKNIRSDRITWIDGSEHFCRAIRKFIAKVDAVITKASTLANNGEMGCYNLKSRTKAMVACYPGDGSHYVKHVDNPNNDGRCITATYYLNQDWDIKKNGGLLRIFPEGCDQVADIEPQFDRIIFFWSDRRNPHEVQPAYHTRYAITLWYFNDEERKKACQRISGINKPFSQ